MGTHERPVDAGSARGQELLARAGREIRAARRERGLSLDVVGGAVGLSAGSVSRVERGLHPGVSLLQLARLHAVVGLTLSSRSDPGGQPIRDVAHVRLLEALRVRLHRSLRWELEVPMPNPNDRRAWDATITARPTRGASFAYGVEAETSPRDCQALQRRMNLKVRDSGVDGVILLLADTLATRAFVREARAALAADFPVDGTRALELLRAGADPGGGAVVVLHRSHRRT